MLKCTQFNRADDVGGLLNISPCIDACNLSSKLKQQASFSPFYAICSIRRVICFPAPAELHSRTTSLCEKMSWVVQFRQRVSTLGQRAPRFSQHTINHKFSAAALLQVKFMPAASCTSMGAGNVRGMVTTRSGRRAQAAKAANKEDEYTIQVSKLFADIVAGTSGMLDGAGNLRVEHNSEEVRTTFL